MASPISSEEIPPKKSPPAACKQGSQDPHSNIDDIQNTAHKRVSPEFCSKKRRKTRKTALQGEKCGSLKNSLSSVFLLSFYWRIDTVSAGMGQRGLWDKGVSHFCPEKWDKGSVTFVSLPCKNGMDLPDVPLVLIRCLQNEGKPLQRRVKGDTFHGIHAEIPLSQLFMPVFV